ncbi:MAG TPA: hypothetical protein VMM93_05670 [Vicinamibacterales bacterium]|nr:hypothetical protein [Vicinamibacterales bacterium]
MLDRINEARNPVRHILPFAFECRVRIAHVVALRELDDAFNCFWCEDVFLDGGEYRLVHRGDRDTQRVGTERRPVPKAPIRRVALRPLDHQSATTLRTRRQPG